MRVAFRSTLRVGKSDRFELVSRRHALIQRTSLRRAFALLGIAGLVGAADLSFAQTAPVNSQQEFNIPSQSLGAALDRYGDITGREALYDTSLAAGRVSGEVRGLFAPDEALKRLLLGTGLSAQFVAENAFVLVAQPRERATNTTSQSDRRYYGVIQEDILEALCRSRSARPGHYRFIAMFWIGPDGTIEKPRRIGSTGSVDADQKIDAALQSIRFSEPPPVGFAQPVLILIVPKAQGVTLGCSKAASALGSSRLP